MLTLLFFKNSNEVAVADLYLNERRLIATTHPATIVGAMFAMERSQLKVVTSLGTHTGNIEFSESDAEQVPLNVLKMRMDINPRLYQFTHLASDASQKVVLEGLDLFSKDNWRDPNEICDEYIRIAYHHLPQDVIKRQLVKPAPKDWSARLKKRNNFIYFPNC